MTQDKSALAENVLSLVQRFTADMDWLRAQLKARDEEVQYLGNLAETVAGVWHRERQHVPAYADCDAWPCLQVRQALERVEEIPTWRKP